MTVALNRSRSSRHPAAPPIVLPGACLGLRGGRLVAPVPRRRPRRRHARWSHHTCAARRTAGRASRAGVGLGLWLTRRRPPVAQAAAVAGLLGLLLVPTTGVHDQIDFRLAAAGQHHHRRRAGTRLFAPPGRIGEPAGRARRPPCPARAGSCAAACAAGARAVGPAASARVRRVRLVATGVAVASVSLLVLIGTGSTGNAVATASDTPPTIQFVLTDNPGNWFDAGVEIMRHAVAGGRRSWGRGPLHRPTA